MLKEEAMSRIMLVDDEPHILKALERLLHRSDHEVEVYQDPQQALKRFHTATFDLVVSDYRMPGMDGVAFLKEVKTLQPDVMRLILSAYGDLDALKSAINEAEIYRFISKPWNDFELTSAIDKALEHRRILVENRRLAEKVRQQHEQLSRQEQALKELEQKHPEIAKVVWGADGSVILDSEEMD
jgi:two-component system probable response regulator PhcQ